MTFSFLLQILRHINRVAGSVMWGTFMIVSPADLLPANLIVWGILLGVSESRCIKRGRAAIGLIYRPVIVIAILIWGDLASPHYLDREVWPVTSQEKVIPFSEAQRFLALQNVRFRIPRGSEEFLVEMPDEKTSLREFFASIEDQTGLELSISFCATMAPIYGSLYPISIGFYPKRR